MIIAVWTHPGWQFTLIDNTKSSGSGKIGHISLMPFNDNTLGIWRTGVQQQKGTG